jgi:hypothetical protein
LLRCQDLLRFRYARGHRLFQQHVDTSFQRGHHEGGMPRIGSSHIYGVNFAGGQQRAILLVRPRFDVVFFSQLIGLNRVAGYQRRELGVVGARNARHKRLLRNLTTRHDGVANFLRVFEHSIG